jgi:hypothetical protein
MSTISSPSLLVKCPHCSETFTPEDAIGHDIRIQLEKEFEKRLQATAKAVEARVAKQESDRYREKFMLLEEDRKIKTGRLQEFEKNALMIAERERQLKDREEGMEVEMKRRWLEREKLVREQADKFAHEKATLRIREEEQKIKYEREQMDVILRKRVQQEAEKTRDEERMKQLELQKKLDDQTKLINEMKRKSEQGSMQMQGEVQELAIEEYLEFTFPRDQIEEISKGKRGGDCVHIVRDHYGNRCGSILYESKRTKHFGNDWLSKIKDDQRLKQADIAVIVTEALPEGMVRLGELEGVWICSFGEFKALAMLLRQNLSRIGEILASQENKGDKMQLIYRYVTSNEFKQKLEASFEAYHEMQEDLLKEKTMITAQWAKREKRLLKAMENLVALYGDVRGIAGGAVQEIKALEIPELLLEE